MAIRLSESDGEFWFILCLKQANGFPWVKRSKWHLLHLTLNGFGGDRLMGLDLINVLLLT